MAVADACQQQISCTNMTCEVLIAIQMRWLTSDLLCVVPIRAFCIFLLLDHDRSPAGRMHTTDVLHLTIHVGHIGTSVPNKTSTLLRMPFNWRYINYVLCVSCQTYKFYSNMCFTSCLHLSHSGVPVHFNTSVCFPYLFWLHFENLPSWEAAQRTFWSIQAVHSVKRILGAT